MDTAEDERATLDKLPGGDRNQIPDRREDDRGMGRLWCSLVRAAGPFATERPGKVLSLSIIGTRECEDLPALMLCDLGYYMSCSTEAKDGEPLGWPRSLKGAIPDETRAQQRRGVKVIVH
ncbi:MAG: hypothetical protein RLZ98_2240 [Pseudomonadota bacterium]|jgi:hypothetical protein